MALTLAFVSRAQRSRPNCWPRRRARLFFTRCDSTRAGRDKVAPEKKKSSKTRCHPIPLQSLLSRVIVTLMMGDVVAADRVYNDCVAACVAPPLSRLTHASTRYSTLTLALVCPARVAATLGLRPTKLAAWPATFCRRWRTATQTPLTAPRTTRPCPF